MSQVQNEMLSTSLLYIELHQSAASAQSMSKAPLESLSEHVFLWIKHAYHVRQNTSEQKYL